MNLEISPWAIRGMVLLALLLAITPAVELLSTIWPLNPSDLIWRYGALGLAAAYLPNLALGVALVVVMAAWQKKPNLLRVAGWAGISLALLIVPAMAMFALDVVQVRALRPEDQQSALLVSGILQEIKYLASGLVLLSMGAGALGSRLRSGHQMGAGVTGTLKTGGLG